MLVARPPDRALLGRGSSGSGRQRGCIGSTAWVESAGLQLSTRPITMHTDAKMHRARPPAMRPVRPELAAGLTGNPSVAVGAGRWLFLAAVKTQRCLL
jgi:hypothetical protein